MALTDLGNCRHYWEFNSSNYSSGFADQVGSATATLNTGSPSYVTANSVQGLDLSGGTQYLTVAEVECLGEISWVGVYGYRGGGTAYGWCTLTNIAGFNFYQLFTGNNATFWRSAGAATTTAPLNQSGVNVHSFGTRLEAGQIWGQVDDDSEVTNSGNPAANDVTFNTHTNWQFGRRYTTLDPIQQIYETAVYIGDVSQDSNYATEIAALKTKYGIT